MQCVCVCVLLMGATTKKVNLEKILLPFSTNGFGRDFIPNDYSAKLLLKLYLKVAQLAV